VVGEDTPAEGDVGNLCKASRLRWRARFAVGEDRGRCRAGEVDHVNNGGHILIISVCYEPDVLVQSNAITPLVEYEDNKVDVRLRELGAVGLVLVRVK
jgi:hypothetical protein